MPTAPLRQFVTKQHKQLTTRQLNRQNDTSELPERQNPMTERRRFLTNVLSLQSERSFRLVNPVIFGQMNYQFYHPQWENAVHVATVGSIIRYRYPNKPGWHPDPHSPQRLGNPLQHSPLGRATRLHHTQLQRSALPSLHAKHCGRGASGIGS